MSSRLLLEPKFSIEQRTVARSDFDLAAQPDFLLLHIFKSQLSNPELGTSFLANPNQAVQLPLNRRKTELLLIRLKPELLIETATRLRLCQTGAHLLFRSPLEPLTDEKLSQTLRMIATELIGGSAGWREMIASSVNQLAVHLLRAHINVRRSDEIELSRAGLVDRRLRRAIEFMHDNCGRELSLSEIASAAYLSEFHFARLFKKITGLTPHAYLASLRIEKARRLLAESDLPIVEVGATVGYASQSHFTKVFREATGLTPRTFRHALTNQH
jgi:AraC family transcriptional regulator